MAAVSEPSVRRGARATPSRAETSRPVVERSGGNPGYAQGEQCQEPGCETVLSRYNSGTRCAQHTPTR